MPYRREDVLVRLVALVGHERAEGLLRESLRAVGAEGDWDDVTSHYVVERLASVPGAVGSAMRQLRAHETTGTRRVAGRQETGRPSPTLLKLVTMLGASLGEEKARSLVDDVIDRRQLPRDTFARDDAFVVLEELARQPGVVGTVARFAKARVHLEVG